MSKHRMYHTDMPPKPSSLPVHPIWRGIGCLMVVAIPALLFFVASMLIENKENYPWLLIPQDIVFSNLKDPFLLVKILYAGLGTLVAGLLIALVTFFLNRFLGPSKYGPTDVPLEDVLKNK